MRGRLVATVLGAAIAAAGAAPAAAAGVDRASTRTFLADATRYVRVSASRHSQLTAAVRRFIEHVRASCPGSLASAPPPIVEHALGQPPSKEGMEGTPAQRATSQTFLTLALGELQIAHFAPVRALALGFATELARLRWRNPVVARAAADFRRSLLATLRLSSPDLCAGARASAATAFASAPPEATRFADAFGAATRVNKGRTLIELADLMRPALAHGDLELLSRFQRLWFSAAPLLQVSDAAIRSLLRTLFQPHRAG